MAKPIFCLVTSMDIELSLTPGPGVVISSNIEMMIGHANVIHPDPASVLSASRRGTLLSGGHPLGPSALMDSNLAVSALGALAQEHRLGLFRLLVQAGPDGMAAGAIAEALGLPNSSLSFHLAQLKRSGLITQERRHRSLIYRADYAAMDALVGYLMENCCGGAVCAPDSRCGDDAAQQERKSA